MTCFFPNPAMSTRNLTTSPHQPKAMQSHFHVFFFQAEDGIRDWSVTGVQTCALPISHSSRHLWKKGKKMTLGLVGRKVGMTRVFTDDGDSLPVTVLDVSDNRVTQIKSAATDGYSAVQVTFGKRRASRVNKAAAGHLAKAAVEAGHILREFRVPESELGNFKLGGKVGVDIFKVGQKVDVSGMSQGKGFAGVIKRHHFSSNRASHGNSLSTNKPGSTGMAQDPGRVFPGKRMAGHLGAAQRTVQGLEVVRVDAERQLLLIKGSVPGSRGRDIVVRPTTKATRVKGPSPKAAPSKATPGAAKAAAAPAAKAAPAPAAKGA